MDDHVILTTDRESRDVLVCLCGFWVYPWRTPDLPHLIANGHPLRLFR